jgi:hypothetical protein
MTENIIRAIDSSEGEMETFKPRSEGKVFIARALQTVNLFANFNMKKSKNQKIIKASAAVEAPAQIEQTGVDNIIHCRTAVGVQLPPTKSTPWVMGEAVEFVYVPAGTAIINAGFRNDETITIAVEVDALTAEALQESVDHIYATSEQEIFCDEDHEGRRATLTLPKGQVNFTYGEIRGHEGVIVRGAEPTSYGAECANGKVYRSFSPEFSTDADYSKAHCKKKHWTFPDGVRGSETNPARITGLNSVAGAMTNRPAFKAMPHVKAKKAELEEDLIQAKGTSEGAKKGWEQRGHGLKSYIEEISGIGGENKLSMRTTADSGAYWIHSKLGSYSSSQAKEIHDKLKANMIEQGFKKVGEKHGREDVASAGQGHEYYSNGKTRVALGGTGFSNDDWNSYVHVQDESKSKATDAIESDTIKAVSDDTANADLGVLNTAKLGKDSVKARYNVVKKGDKWHVIKKDGTDEGESDSKEKAEAHLRALYANSPDTKAMEAADVDAEIVKAFETMVDEDLVKAKGTSEGVKKGWETRKMQHGGMMSDEKSPHNITAVTHSGSPILSQIWSGGSAAAAQEILEWHKRGEKSKEGESTWYEPIAHAYMHSHKTHETRHYDMSNLEHLSHLKQMAEKVSAEKKGTTFEKATDKIISPLDTLYARNDENQRIVDGFTNRIPNIGSREIVDKFCAKVGAKKATAQP